MKSSKIVLFLILAFALSACRSSSALFSRGKVSYQIDADDVCEIPMRIKRNLFFLDVKIDGETYNFLFDSGAPMVISASLAEKYDCRVLRDGRIRDSQNKVRRQPYVLLPDLQIGDRLFTGLAGLASDLKASAILNCLGIDGIIGANAMALQYWDFSVKDSLLRMSRNKEHWPRAKKYVLPFGMKNTRTPLVKMRINGTDVSNITFDTGSSGVLSFNKSMMTSFKAEEALFSSYGYLSGGLFGSVLDTAHEFMMTFNFPDTNLRLPVEQEMKKKGKLLGMGFLRHFHVFIDYSKREILLMPKTNVAERPIFPLAPIYEQGSVIIGMINSLMPDSLAHLEIGDTIIAYNGIALPDKPEVADYCAMRRTFQAAEIELEILNKGRYRFRRKAKPLE